MDTEQKVGVPHTRVVELLKVTTESHFLLHFLMMTTAHAQVECKVATSPKSEDDTLRGWLSAPLPVSLFSLGNASENQFPSVIYQTTSS